MEMSIHKLILSLSLLLQISSFYSLTLPPKKIETITPFNTNSNGIRLLTHSTEVIPTQSQWNVQIASQSSWQFILILDNTWGFDPDVYSAIQITINSDSIATGPLPTFDWLLFGFTVDNSDYFSAIIPMDNHQANHIFPACDQSPIPTQSYGIDDISALPDHERACDIAGRSCNNWQEMLPVNWRDKQPSNQHNAFPITFIMENDPKLNIFRLTYKSGSFTNNFAQQCGFRAIRSGNGFKLYLGGNKFGQRFSIQSFELISYSHTKAPTHNPSHSPSKSPTNNPSNSPSKSPTKSPSTNPSKSPSNIPSTTPTYSPSNAPTQPPSNTPTTPPSDTPSFAPTQPPSNAPSNAPSDNPTPAPSDNPSNAPSMSPVSAPSNAPSISPLPAPTNNPSVSPTPAPTNIPSPAPTNIPTITPTNYPSTEPTMIPTYNPTFTYNPTENPSETPTNNPSKLPTSDPTPYPTPHPTKQPSGTPTSTPSMNPSRTPSTHPTSRPTYHPTFTVNPTSVPTADPTTKPTNHPTNDPTTKPSNHPTNDPTTKPTNHPIATNDPTNDPTHDPTTQPTNTPTYTNTDAIVAENTDDSFAAVVDTKGELDDFIIPVSVCAIALFLIVIARCVCWKVKQQRERKQSVQQIGFIEIVKEPKRSTMTSLKSASPMSSHMTGISKMSDVGIGHGFGCGERGEYIITVHYENKQFQYTLQNTSRGATTRKDSVCSEFNWNETTFDELRSTIAIQFSLAKSSFTLYEIVDGDPVDIDDIDDIVAVFDFTDDVLLQESQSSNDRNMNRNMNIYVQICGGNGNGTGGNVRGHGSGGMEGDTTEYTERSVTTTDATTDTTTDSSTEPKPHEINRRIKYKHGKARSRSVRVGSMNVDLKLDELMGKLKRMKSAEEMEEHGDSFVDSFVDTFIVKSNSRANLIDSQSDNNDDDDDDDDDNDNDSEPYFENSSFDSNDKCPAAIKSQ